MKNIVVAGSHGKTTTTSLISGIFANAKLDPTIINGGVLNSLGNSARLGKSDWCVLESDESDGSFLHLPATYSIVTNIDQEHMDYYKNLKNLKDKFVSFIENTPSFGKSFICIDDVNVKTIVKNLNHKNFYTYGVDKNSNYRIFNIRKKIEFSTFDLKISLPGKKLKIIKNIKIPIIGIHNIRNATAALAVSSSIGISDATIKKGLNNYEGVQRRFNKLFTFQEAIFFDDYAHHPTEIKSVLNSLKLTSNHKKIVSVFQPHRYSRLRLLKNDFASAFKDSDLVVLCPVYAAGEKVDPKYKSKEFAKLISKNSKVQVIMVKDKVILKNFFIKNLISDELVICMGAGSISNWLREMDL